MRLVTITIMSDDEPLALPDFVRWPIFPFEGDLRVRPVKPLRERDRPRSGEPGGPPCETCVEPDDKFIWVDDRWRIRTTREPTGVPVQLFIETRAHVDMNDLDDDMAGELGRLLVRVDRAVLAGEGIGRTHFSRWGDGGSHFHMWVYGRPRGSTQMLGFGLPMWAMICDPTPVDAWHRNLDVIATELARGGGRALRPPS